MDAITKQQEARMAVYTNIAAAYREAQTKQNISDASNDAKVNAASAAVAVTQSTVRNEQANPKDAFAGREILEKAYGRNAENIANIMTGRVADFDFPKGVAGRTDDMNKLVRQGQQMTDNANMSAYIERNTFRAAGPNGNYLVSDNPATQEATEKLVRHMLTIKASVEAQVDTKQLSREQADSAMKRIEKETFQRETPHVKPEFTAFEKRNGESLQRGVMNEVENRYVDQRLILSRVSEKEVLTQANRDKAADFRNLPREDAVKKHPDLINAFALVKTASLVAEGKFSSATDREKFTTLMKERVAQQIEKGQKLPEVSIKQGQQQNSSREKSALEMER